MAFAHCAYIGVYVFLGTGPAIANKIKGFANIFGDRPRDSQ